MKLIRILRYIKYLEELTLYFLLLPISFLVNRKRKIFLVSERGTDARDNGYHFYKYLKMNYPEIESYYVIDKKSSDYNKVSELGDIIQWRSLKHRIIFIAAKYKISTHIMGYTPNIEFFIKLNKYIPLIGKKIFLQHGITKDDLPVLYQEATKLDLFICGAKPEYDFIKKNFHYRQDVVRYTGLARYDSLNEFYTENQILIMPTWRMYLNNQNEELISKSEYVRAWNDVLTNKELVKIIREKNIKIYFYPHHEMQKYLNVFKSKDANIVIADSASYDVQDLLKKSKLLITDYSSVFFDFGYMKKPCIYYQFDKERFYLEHYKRGYFDYDKDGFGEVVMDGETIIGEVIKIINNNFELDKDYIYNVNRFFELRDHSNCERIYKEICRL